MNSIRSVEIYIATLAEEVHEATKQEYSASDVEKYTVEKVAVVAKCEAAKDFNIGTKYLKCNMCGKYISLISALLNQFKRATRASGRG